jgi:hypothetical protein
MKISKSFILYLLVVFLLVSISFNIKGCREDVQIVDEDQKKIDSLYAANRLLDGKNQILQADIKKDAERVAKLQSICDSLLPEIKDLKRRVKKQKDIIADNDRKIKGLKGSKVDLTDSELNDFLNTKFPK